MILLTGACTGLGRTLLDHLQRHGAPVRAADGDLRGAEPDIRWRRSAAPQPGPAALQGVGSLVLCPRLRPEAPEAVHHAWTVLAHGRLLEQARPAGVKRVVLASSLGVARGWDAPWAAALRALEQLLVHSGLPYTIVRLGPDQSVFRAVSRLGPVQLIPGPGRNRVSALAAEDAVRFITATLTREELVSGIIEAGGPPIRPWDLIGGRGLALPATLVATARRLPRRSGGWGRRLHALHPWFTEDVLVDPCASASALGLPPPGPLALRAGAPSSGA